jgi:acetyl-CoA C-acetyltransferase
MTDRTPVLAGIGIATQREEDPTRAQDPLALMIAAAREAGQDAAPALLATLGRVYVPKGRWAYADPSRAIADALEAVRAESMLATVGVLQQSLIGEACAAIAAGEIEAALVVGGDAGYRLLRAQIAGVELPEREAPGTPDRVLAPKEDLRHPAEVRAGLRMPVGLYAIMESAWRARRGMTLDAHRDFLAKLYGRFSNIAAGNPHAWTRRPVPPEDIRDPGPRNPMQAFPYTKLHCSSWNVDQAAALLFCSAGLAARLGVPAERIVHPWASTESNHMVPVSARRALEACSGARIAGRAALAPFGLQASSLDLVELYSCFPIAVHGYAAELGLDLGRDLTVTGGMNFAGGPYNNYVLQATARMAELLRAGRGRTGLVSSVSGVLTKQGFGLWSTAPAPGGFRFADVSAEVAAVMPAREVDMAPNGTGRIAGYTVLHDRKHPPRAVVVADLADGRRAVATSEEPGLLARMEREEFVGAPVWLDGERFGLAAP